MQEPLSRLKETKEALAATGTGQSLSKSELRWARMLRVAPWLAFFVVALPVPVIFFALSFFFLAEAPFFVLMALLSLGVGAVAGLLTTIFLLIYRSRWTKKVRQRLATDGVKTSELDWFLNELSTQERKALNAMQNQDPLLADAYRETLAMRLTATHVLTRTKKDLRSIEQRVNKLAYIKDTDTSALRRELGEDKSRLNENLRLAQEHEANARLRLQTIEAAVQRGANWADTNRALQRLTVSGAQLPLALEMARQEQEALNDSVAELQTADKP
jgi:hypothetical protein